MHQEQSRRRTYRRAEDLYGKSVEGVKDYAIIMTDPEGGVLSWNRGAELILGYGKAEILGRNASLFFTPEDRQRREHEKEMATAAAEGQAEDERWHVRRDGTRFWAGGVLTSITDDAGALLGFTKIMRDKTEQKRLEGERDRLFTLSMDMLCIVGLEGSYRRVNPAFEKTLGHTAEELLAAPIFDFIHPEDRPVLKAEYVKLSAGEPTAYLENRCRCKDGTYKWVGWTYFPVPEEGIAYGAGRDVTGRRRMEEALRLRAGELEQANRVKDEFLATLSHELRTPLTSILGWTRLLRGGQLGEAMRERAVEIIERNAERQSKLIEDLLDVSRIITGKLRLDTRPVELAPVVEAAVNSFQPAAAAKQIRLESLLDSEAGPVMGDPDRLQQVITNLLANAVKFTPEGGRVEVRLERAGSGARLTVRDTGVGIGAEVLPYVFDRFRQADSTDTRKYSGLGLGLSIVRHLVERHGGAVRAESRGEGEGATFTVNFPLATTLMNSTQPEQTRTAAEPVRMTADTGGPDGDPCALAGVRVLLVEDEPDTRDFITLILERCGAGVTAVGSAGEAVEALERVKPDVLVSDIGMAGVNGYEMIGRIRALGPGRGGRVPAVALTAYAGPQDRRRALLAGFQAHLAKPVEPDDLILVVGSLGWRGGNSD